MKFMLEENKPDNFEIDAGAQRLAIRTVIQTLVEHDCTTDPGLRDRIGATINNYITKPAATCLQFKHSTIRQVIVLYR